MTITIKIENKNNVLRVFVSGEYTLASAKETFTEMLGAMAKYNVDKSLIDCRELVQPNETTIELFDYSESIAKELHSRNFSPSLAYLHTPDNLTEAKQFAENVAINRGVRARVFDDRDIALRWLYEQ